MTLSPQQLRILQRLANGEKRAVIASEMNLALGTVNDYIDRIYKRLDAHTPAQALSTYLRLRGQQPDLALH